MAKDEQTNETQSNQQDAGLGAFHQVAKPGLSSAKHEVHSTLFARPHSHLVSQEGEEVDKGTIIPP